MPCKPSFHHRLPQLRALALGGALTPGFAGCSDEFTGNTGTVTKTQRDSRMVAPIAIDVLETHGTEGALVSVADFGSKSVIEVCDA